MIAVRAYWILPNRDQRDDVFASDGRVTVPLRQLLDPRRRPDGFSHGVPTELLEKCGPKGLARILFAQKFPGWDGDKQIFCVSATAGVDPSGRIVHIGLVFVLGPGERPSFDLSYSALPAEDREHARALIDRMTSAGRDDPWAQSVRDLLELPADAGPATNVALDRSTVPFRSLYELGPNGSPRKAANRARWRTRALLLSVVIAVVGAWFSHAKSCSGAPRLDGSSLESAGGNGGTSWRFN